MPEVAVIGLGRVGLPLAISFADRGLTVLGVDKDADRLQAVRDGRMPFEEPGAQDALDRVHAAGTLTVSDRVADATLAEHIVITLGTPSFSHIEIDISDIRSALDDLLPPPARGPHDRPALDDRAGHDGLRRRLPRQAPRLSRSARTSSSRMRPSGSPPGASSRRSTRCRASSAASARRSGERVGALFSIFGAPIVQTTPVQAELAKIWTNILRYANFALPNLLMMDCEQHGANVFDVIDLINRDYPRGGIAKPGLTGGTCLRKDFAFSEERSNAPGMLLAVSRVNESVPLFLVEGMKRRLGSLNGRKIAVLGLAFKGNTDDERDSLAHKLVRLLERELADVAVHDPRVATPTPPFEEAVAGADAVVIAANHDEFMGPDVLHAVAAMAGGGALVVDPWNCFGAGQVFGYVAELSAMTNGRVALP